MCPFAARASAEPCFVPGLLRGPRIGGEAPLLASRDGGRACDVVVVCAAKKSNWRRGKGVVRAGPCGGGRAPCRESLGGGPDQHRDTPGAGPCQCAVPLTRGLPASRELRTPSHAGKGPLARHGPSVPAGACFASQV